MAIPRRPNSIAQALATPPATIQARSPVDSGVIGQFEAERGGVSVARGAGALHGRFHDDYFSPYQIATVPHEPWQEKPIPIAPGIWPKVLELVKQKVKNRTYEWSQSSYRGQIFPMLKKDRSPWIIHNMQKLNGVTIRDSMLPPNIEDVVEGFAGHACYTIFDIFVGYDNQTLALESHDMTLFLVPGFGLLCLTSLPMGATNAMAKFQACMTFILQEEIPGVAGVFVDDVLIKGAKTWYEQGDGFEVLPENPGI
ncbi:hypothetical protein OPQ81_011065 [Rhizoctonia solani]|nr:hypothetical protein OPQ81_011065 [Rhizoctonia solani]